MPALAPLASSYVWLSIDFENPGNSPFLRRFVTLSLPTLWVIEPADETPMLKWIGAATANELRDEGRQRVTAHFPHQTGFLSGRA